MTWDPANQPLDDPNSDAVVNLMAYALHAPNPSSNITPYLPRALSGSPVGYRIPQAARPDIVYNVQTKLNLEDPDWISAAFKPTENNNWQASTNFTVTTNSMGITISPITGNSRTFYRLQVYLTNSPGISAVLPVEQKNLQLSWSNQTRP
jgi:hypothetical protein